MYSQYLWQLPLLLASTTSAQSLVNVLTQSGQATTLLKLVQTDGPLLNALGTFQGTLFAPTDSAFSAALQNGARFGNSTTDQVLAYHAVPGIAFAKDSFSGTAFLKSLNGDEIKASGSSQQGIALSTALNAPPANVVSSLPFTGGIVHFIDQTLTPLMPIFNVGRAAGLTSLAASVVQSGLADTLMKFKNVTLFAPSNAAFAAIADVANGLTKQQLAQILLLHVIPGQVLHSTEFVQAGTSRLTTAAKETVTVTAEGGNVVVMGAGNMRPATVTTADVLAKNGLVVHVIDMVLMPANLNATGVGATGGETAGGETNAIKGKGNGGAVAVGASNAGGKGGVAQGAMSTKSLIQVLTENNANTLLQLVKSDTVVLNAFGAFQGTLFAPSDAALAATVQAGFDPKNIDALSTELQYHAIPSTVLQPNFAGTQFLQSLEGDEVKAISGPNSINVSISSAFGAKMSNVLSTVPFNGGMVFFIDTTLTVPDAIATVAKNANLNALLNALMMTNLVETVAALKGATVFAPSDAAFAAVASATSKMSADQLKQILLMHVVPMVAHSTDIMQQKTLPSVKTAAGGMQTLDVEFDGNNVLVKGMGNATPAKVITADVLCQGNVVVHVIDMVLLPGNLMAANTAPALAIFNFACLLTILLA
ncbi:FAS1 domain-containing protein [Chytriomyces sp. MP71]|nr:FAS1 domain-containing protein [Chytriomyces sp. MP71]